MTPSTNPNQALWEKGDFTRIAAAMRASGQALVKTIGVERGIRVLDLGCGDGTTALPAALIGANVLGVDIARNLVDAGNRRAAQAGLSNLKFLEGDATDLSPLADGSFDMVVTVFGAMFAPRPFDVAREMVRVTKKGGRVVMGNWIPGDPTLVAQILKISAAYTPPPPDGFVSPMTWGLEPSVLERFTEAGVPRANIDCRRATFTFDFDGTPGKFVDTFRRFDGPTMNAFDAAEKNGRTEALRSELEALFENQNRGTDPARTTIVAAYLLVTVLVA